MFLLRFILSILIILINFNSILKAETLTFPTNLVANTTSFVLLSTSGTTPTISGYSGTLLFSAVASAGNIKVTDTSNQKVKFTIYLFNNPSHFTVNDKIVLRNIDIFH